MKFKLITFFSIATTVALLVVSNHSISSASTTNYKICKHNGDVFAIIPVNNSCSYEHSRISTSPSHHRAKESHLCVITEEHLSGL